MLGVVAFLVSLALGVGPDWIPGVPGVCVALLAAGVSAWVGDPGYRVRDFSLDTSLAIAWWVLDAQPAVPALVGTVLVVGRACRPPSGASADGSRDPNPTR